MITTTRLIIHLTHERTDEILWAVQCNLNGSIHYDAIVTLRGLYMATGNNNKTYADARRRLRERLFR